MIERVTDVDRWATRVQLAVSQLMRDFEERFGYTPGRNVVIVRNPSSDPVRDPGVARSTVPNSVVRFFDVIEEMLLPDVWNGYFLGPRRRVMAAAVDDSPGWLIVDGEPIAIQVIGSDGGGALYVVRREGNDAVFRVQEGASTAGVLRTSIREQTRLLSSTFDAFLELFASELETFAAGTRTPSL